MTTTTALRTILLATDFSTNAGVARAWTEQLARQHGAAVVLVNVFREGPGLAPEFVPLPQYCYDDIRARLESALADEAQTLRRTGLTVDYELGYGNIVEVILAAAKRRGADLIVAGTRGRTAWKNLMLGSTAVRLLQTAPCPVLTVRPMDTLAPRRVRSVLVPTDFSEDAALAAEAAKRLLGGPTKDRRIVLLHAYHVPADATSLPASMLMDAISAVDAAAQRTIEEFAATVRATGIHVETITCEGQPPESIIDYARSRSVDAIAMGTHGRSGIDRLVLGSTAERVVTSAPCPVLTVRREPH